MKKIFGTIALLITTLFLSQKIHAQGPWQKTNGPYGGTVSSMDTFGGYLWANTEAGGIYRSSNDGGSWEVYNNGINFTFLDHTNTLHAANGALWLTTNAQGILKLDNPDGTWTSVLGGHFYHLVHQGTTLFAAKYSPPFIYKSTDNGLTWTPSSTGIVKPSYGFYGLVANGPYLLVSFYDAGDAKVYRSTDAGATWSEGTSPSLPTAYDFSRFRVVDDKIFVFFSTGSSAPLPTYTTDGGLTWTTVTNPTGVITKTQDIMSLNGRYLCLDDYYVQDYAKYGLACLIRSDFQQNFRRFNSTYFYAGAKIFLLGDRLLKCDTNLTNFQFCDSGMTAYKAAFIGGNGTRIITQTGENSIVGTNNGGTTWDLDTLFCAVGASCQKGSSWFVGGNNSGVLKSTDGGYHFNPINKGFASYEFGTASVYPQTNALHNTPAGKVLAGNSNQLYELNTGDTSWTLKYDFPISVSGINYPWITTINSGGGYLFVGTGGGGFGELYRSADGGATYTIVSIDSAYRDAQSFAIFEDKLYFSNGSYGIFRSSDWGNSWVQFDTGVVSIYPNKVSFGGMSQVGTRLYGGLGGDNDLYQLAPGTTTWENITPLATDPRVKAWWGSGDSVLYVTTANSGVWKRDVTPTPSSIGWQPVTNLLSSTLFPNPSGTPSISIADAKALPAAMTIYDAATGKTLKTQTLTTTCSPIHVNAAPAVYIIDIVGKDGSRARLKWTKPD